MQHILRTAGVDAEPLEESSSDVERQLRAVGFEKRHVELALEYRKNKQEVLNAALSALPNAPSFLPAIVSC